MLLGVMGDDRGLSTPYIESCSATSSIDGRRGTQLEPKRWLEL